MKKNILYLLILTFVSSCSNDQNSGIDCSLIDCFGGDDVKLTFYENGENIFEIDPNTEIEIIQNNKNADYSINTFSNEVIIYLYDNDPITIRINNQELNMEISSTFIERECCSGIEVDNLTINDLILCEDGECDEVLQINIDGLRKNKTDFAQTQLLR